jgi:hypothetical protein
MKRITQLLFALAFVATFAGAASAQTNTPRIDQRRVMQHERIRDGVRGGRLTPREAQRLRMEQRHIRRSECRAKADGFVTPGERARLNHMQNRHGRHIYRLKHNGREA